MPPILEKVMRIQRHNTRLIGLCHIGKDTIDHAHEHAVLERVARIFNDGNDIGAGLGHVDEVPTGTVREFHGIDGTRGAHNVTHVTDRRSGGSANVQDLVAWFDPNVTDSAQDGSGDFVRERIEVRRRWGMR